MRATRSPLAVLALASLAHGQPTAFYVWPYSQHPIPNGTQLDGRVIDLSGGRKFSLAIREDFVLVGWGVQNDFGQQGYLPGPDPPVGNGYPPQTPCGPGGMGTCIAPPSPMPPLLRASGGYDHVLALVKGNAFTGPGRFSMVAWGRNDAGQSAVPDLTVYPWNIEPTAQVADLQAGEYINLVLFDNGQIAAWGHNWYGVDPRSSLSSALPLYQAYLPPHPWRFKQIACGGHFVAALRRDDAFPYTHDGEIICWGMFDYRAPHDGPLVWGPGYRGTMMERDAAYHNGTVWPWLLGPYAEAVMRVGGFSAESRAEARAVLMPLVAEMEGLSLGQLPEVYDAEPPHGPGGCPAQAWSVAETLRVLWMAAEE